MKKILMLSILLIVSTAQAEIVIVHSVQLKSVENTTMSLGITVACIGGKIGLKDSTSLIQMYTTTKCLQILFQ